jgi:hypothetical protein
MDKFELLRNYIHSRYKNIDPNELTKREHDLILEMARIVSMPEPKKDPNFIEKSKVIQKIVENLDNSTKTTWTSGYLDDWSAYAKKMKAEIVDAINLLKLM